MKWTRLMLLLVLLMMSSWAIAQPPRADIFSEAQRLETIAYNDNNRQRLDLYLPERSGPVPVLFVVHGGGYVAGNQEQITPFAEEFARQGYAVVAPTYRLAPRHQYPAQIEDVFCALAWTYNHAERYGLDMSRLVLIGESAGANAVTMLASIDQSQDYLDGCAYTLPDERIISAVIAYYMPVDLSTCNCWPAKQIAALYLGVDASSLADEESARATWAKASPLPWLDGSEPPFLLIHGSDDRLVPFSESELMAASLEAVGIPVELIAIEGADHGFFAEMQRPEAQLAADIVRDYLDKLFVDG